MTWSAMSSAWTMQRSFPWGLSKPLQKGRSAELAKGRSKFTGADESNGAVEGGLDDGLVVARPPCMVAEPWVCQS
uniref:Uncharacterized protein n=1 Tax=Fagus sylvatica TaxID=28930 RepID=A0A2N9FFL4_FAGSY